MAIEYIHHPLGEEVEAAAGRYVLQKEARVTVSGREILYLTGFASVDSSCCGNGGCGYAVVPGYLIKWKDYTNKDGLPVSLVEPISDPAIREELSKHIKELEKIEQINFLT